MLDRHVAANRRKAWLLLLMAFLLLAGVLGALWAASGASSTLLLPLAAFAVGAPWVAYYSSDRLVIAATRAVDADPDVYRVLHGVVEEMAIASGLPKPRVMVVDDAAPNAFATGRNERTAVVAVTSGLLAKMDREQLQSVIAHEMAHVANRDMLVSTLAASIAGAIMVLSDIGLRMTIMRRSGNPVMLIVVVLALVLAPLGAALLKAGVSRKRETLADYSAAKMTRNPAGMRRALEALADDSTVLAAPSRITAHLWLEEPTPDSDGAQGTLRRLFATHPPLAERIEAMRNLENGTTPY